MLAAYLGMVASVLGAAPCPIRQDTQVVYSKATGVGGASIIWVEDLLWWLKTNDETFTYQGLVEQDVQACDLASFPNLRLYVNPGGNAYGQLSALGANGTASVKKFISRDQKAEGRSAFAGFCAGGYMAATGYLWETMYEGPGYFNFRTDPPFGFFPHLVEGSLVDIGDDQSSDQFGNKFRVVNVSNGHQMLYFGGSTFGWNAVADFTNPASPNYDSKTEVVLYYSDFFGSAALEGGTFNLPAAWKRKNLFLTSIHSEADNCTVDRENQETTDCTPEGTLTEEAILKNRAWLVTHLNDIAGTEFKIPSDASKPNMSTAKPHTDWPKLPCTGLFCDGFDAAEGEVAHGLWQWQRNQSFYSAPMPWNTSFVDAWPGCARPCRTNGANGESTFYGAAHSGNGYAVCVPRVDGAKDAHISTIESRSVSGIPAAGATLSYVVRGCSNCSADPEIGEVASVAPVAAQTPQQCAAALAKICPGVAHRGPTCHQCVFNHTSELVSAGCNMSGSPPKEISAYCMPGGGGGGKLYPAGAFIVEYRVAGGAVDPEDPSGGWVTLRAGPLHGGGLAPWATETHKIPGGKPLSVRFSCASGNDAPTNFCAVDSVSIA